MQPKDELKEVKTAPTTSQYFPWLIPGIGLVHLGPFLDKHDRNHLAQVSLAHFNLVRAMEKKPVPGQPRPQQMIKLPSKNYNRYKYRAQGARFFEIRPGQGLIATQDHFRSGVGFPILSPDGSNFLKLQGIRGGAD